MSFLFHYIPKSAVLSFSCEQYTNGAWSRHSNLRVEVSELGMSTTPNSILTVGGITPYGVLQDVYEFDANAEEGQWVRH